MELQKIRFLLGRQLEWLKEEQRHKRQCSEHPGAILNPQLRNPPPEKEFECPISSRATL
jgi:hypothetical protein